MAELIENEYLEAELSNALGIIEDAIENAYANECLEDLDSEVERGIDHLKLVVNKVKKVFKNK
jgi:hypothetical protein